MTALLLEDLSLPVPPTLDFRPQRIQIERAGRSGEAIGHGHPPYAIRGMARSWRTDPPYPNWRDYRDSLRDYADDTMRRWPHVEEIARVGLPAFYAHHEARLRANPVDRDLNGSMAVVLLRAFEETPAHWEAVRWLNERRTDAPRTFDAHLADWHASVPERHRPFVERLAALFGRPLPAAAP